MKRTAKISVKRQTVRILGTEEVKDVAGGVTAYKCTGDTVESHGPTCGRATVCQSWFYC
jgi:hypothetical protein